MHLLLEIAWLKSLLKFEYKVLAYATTEIAWLKSLLVEIDVQLPFRIVIWSDNLGATSLATNPVPC